MRKGSSLDDQLDSFHTLCKICNLKYIWKWSKIKISIKAKTIKPLEAMKPWIKQRRLIGHGKALTINEKHD